MYYNDPNRREDGTYTVLHGTYANNWEQSQAGVNRYDNPFTADQKVRYERTLRGLDPNTGGIKYDYVPVGGYSGGSYSGGGTSVFRPEPLTPEQQEARSKELREENERLGRWLGALARWLFVYPIVGLAAFFLTWGGLRAADSAWMNASPDGGLARMALAKTFPGAELPPVSAFATAKEISAAMTPEALFAGAATPLTRANAKQKIAPGDAKREWLDLSAYLCQVDATCRAKAMKASPAMAANVFNWSVEYLIEKARSGNAKAAETLCAFPLLVDINQNSAKLAWNVCAHATYGAKLATKKPHEMLNQMRASYWFQAAQWAAISPVEVIQGWTKAN